MLSLSFATTSYSISPPQLPPCRLAYAFPRAARRAGVSSGVILGRLSDLAKFVGTLVTNDALEVKLKDLEEELKKDKKTAQGRPRGGLQVGSDAAQRGSLPDARAGRLEAGDAVLEPSPVVALALEVYATVRLHGRDYGVDSLCRARQPRRRFVQGRF